MRFLNWSEAFPLYSDRRCPHQMTLIKSGHTVGPGKYFKHQTLSRCYRRSVRQSVARKNAPAFAPGEIHILGSTHKLIDPLARRRHWKTLCENDNAKRPIMRADQKLAAFLKLESALLGHAYRQFACRQLDQCLQWHSEKFP